MAMISITTLHVGHAQREQFGTLTAGSKPNPTNNNSTAIQFTDVSGKNAAEIAVFGLDLDTALGLHTFAQLKPEKRKAILPALVHALEEQDAEEEVDAEDG